MYQTLAPYTQPIPGIPDLTGSVTKEPDTIGCGAFSDLFSGHWHVSGRTYAVAIKVLRGVHHDREDYERVKRHLNRESTVWRQLDHANVLPFYGIDYGLSASPSLISPLCQHGDIVRYFKNNPNPSRFSMLLGVARGLEYLHLKNIIHGDLKPQNILVSDIDTPLLCDFGRAKMLNHTGFTTRFAGVFRYLAPELLAHDEDVPKLTKNTDIYAFAIVGAEIATGEPAFTGSEYKIAQKVMSGERPRLLNVRGRSSRACPILAACWAHEPTDRWPMNVVVLRLNQI
ncbi:hypothetical protein APHAL10511_004135 [Amanita phalloides]|nr:hypothetical protein APHAL10511_004135 [Amanita phalloides]